MRMSSGQTLAEKWKARQAWRKSHILLPRKIHRVFEREELGKRLEPFRNLHAGQRCFIIGKRKISKKGNAHLRRHLYLAMNSIMKAKPKTDTAIYDFMIRKKNEHKLNKQVRIAGMHKFLHIYYARVKEKYKELGLWNIEEFL